MEQVGADGSYERIWRRWLILLWLAAAAILLLYRWPQIQFYVLGDTDDNLRMAQVRAWLGGQGWYDLRQYKLDPPAGANIHWSRLVDLPIAGLILLFRNVTSWLWAERLAAGIAPLLPLLLAMFASALTARRLFANWMWLFGAGLFLGSMAALNMFMPMRIDHHGWQLALLALGIAGVADPHRQRGGATTALATGLSLVIGMELLPYLALLGAGTALRWVGDQREGDRLSAYGAVLALTTALGFLVFASYDNRVPRCDALSPVWLAVMVAVGVMMFVLGRRQIARPVVRFGLLAGAAAAALALLYGAWPQCLLRPEGLTPELKRLWFDQIVEVKPIYAQDRDAALLIVVLPVIGALGSLFALWRRRAEGLANPWIGIALIAVCSALMLLWQTRAGPPAQVCALPGCAAFIHAFVPRLHNSSSMLVRVFGVTGAVLLFSGHLPSFAISVLVPEAPQPASMRKVKKAAISCATMGAFKPIAALPAQTIFTFVDLGPRLVNVTHHRAIAGPYHRNGDAILDVYHAFGGSADAALPLIRKHKATMLLICPNSAESTLYSVRSPNGFYAQLASGKVPDWLEPVALPARSGFRLWRVKPD